MSTFDELVSSDDLDAQEIASDSAGDDDIVVAREEPAGDLGGRRKVPQEDKRGVSGAEAALNEVQDDAFDWGDVSEDDLPDVDPAYVQQTMESGDLGGRGPASDEMGVNSAQNAEIAQKLEPMDEFFQLETRVEICSCVESQRFRRFWIDCNPCQKFGLKIWCMDFPLLNPVTTLLLLLVIVGLIIFLASKLGDSDGESNAKVYSVCALIAAIAGLVGFWFQYEVFARSKQYDYLSRLSTGFRSFVNRMQVRVQQLGNMVGRMQVTNQAFETQVSELGEQIDVQVQHGQAINEQQKEAIALYRRWKFQQALLNDLRKEQTAVEEQSHANDIQQTNTTNIRLLSSKFQDLADFKPTLPARYRGTLERFLSDSHYYVRWSQDGYIKGEFKLDVGEGKEQDADIHRTDFVASLKRQANVTEYTMEALQRQIDDIKSRIAGIKRQLGATSAA